MSFKYSDEIKERLKSLGILSYEIKSYIQDSNGVYVDFSDRAEVNGANRLVSVGSITQSSEGKTGTGSFYTTISNIVMDNHDNFWDAPITGLKTVTGATASFDVTKGGHMSVFQRNKIKISMRLQMNNGNFVETPLGVFLIEEIVFSGNTVSVKTVGLAKPLMEQSAEAVKDGISWYTNKPIKFLVEELLKLEYGQLKGAAASNKYQSPTSFIIPNEIDITTVNSERTSSIFGRPPEWDGDVWHNDGLTTRALLWSYTTIGSDQSGNDKDMLYMGCDDELWKYNPDNDTYTSIGSVSDASITGSVIRKLWYNTNDYCIWGASTELAQDDSRHVKMIIFKYNGSTITIEKNSHASNFTDQVFLGDFCMMDGGGYDSDYRTIGKYVDSGAAGAIEPIGWQISSPFVQYMTKVEVGSAGSGGVDLKGKDVITTGIGETYDGNDYNISYTAGSGTPIKKNYYAAQASTSGEATVKMALRYSYGQEGCLLYNDNSDTSGGMFWFYYDSVNDEYEAYYYDINADTVTKEWSLELDGRKYKPTAGCVDSATDRFYFATIGYQEDQTESDEFPLTRIDYYDASADSVTNITTDYNSSSAILEMIHVPTNTAYLYVSFYNISALGNSDSNYGLDKITIADGTEATVSERPWQSKGFVYGTTTDSGDAYNDIYFINCGPGSLSKINVGSNTIESLDFGWPVVDGETNISSNLVIDSDTRSGENSNIIYGSSAPYYPAETQDDADLPVGKYYLWKFDSVYSSRIELADFEGMSIWDALSDFAQLAGYVIGFTNEGDFFFVPRATETNTADYTLSTDPSNNTIMSIQKDLGYKEIYNHCSITPSKAVVQEPKSEFVIRKRDDSANFDSKYAVNQRDTLKKNIRLVCSENGDIEDSDSLFRLLTYTYPVETIITQAYVTSDTTIYLASVFGGDSEINGIHADDYIVVINPDNNQEVISRITAVTTSNNSITIGSKDSDSMPNLVAETTCTILKKNKISSGATTTATRYTEWSDEGITYVTKGYDNSYQQLASVDDLGLQSVVRFGTSGQYARIASINTTSNIIHLKSVDQYTNTPNLSIDVSTTDIVYSWYSPLASSGSNTDYQEIGGTNVYVKWETKSSGNDSIKQGDSFFIECPGKKLEKEEESKQIFVNSNSLSKYGRKEFPSVDNKFVDRKIARGLSKKLVNDWAEPKFLVTVGTILLPYINFVNGDSNQMRVDVQDNKLFSIRKNFTEQCLVRKITHNPMTFTSTFELKGRLNY
jgi:hypothetical protein